MSAAARTHLPCTHGPRGTHPAVPAPTHRLCADSGPRWRGEPTRQERTMSATATPSTAPHAPAKARGPTLRFSPWPGEPLPAHAADSIGERCSSGSGGARSRERSPTPSGGSCLGPLAVGAAVPGSAGRVRVRRRLRRQAVREPERGTEDTGLPHSDGQPETVTGPPAACGLVPEPLGAMVEDMPGVAVPVVPHGDDLAVDGQDHHRRTAMLVGVGDQVPQHALKPALVAPHPGDASAGQQGRLTTARSPQLSRYP